MDLVFVSVLVGAAFIPSLIYLVWIRGASRSVRTSVGGVARTFLYGAVLGVIFAIVLELLMIYLYDVHGYRIYELMGLRSALPEVVVLACIIAPIAEELVKLLGVHLSRGSITSSGDGMVLGASCGLGFAATENLIYEYVALQEGVSAYVAVVLLRSVSSALLHGSATAVSGRGIGLNHLEHRRLPVLSGYLAAVVMHAVFNFFASFGLLYEEVYGPSAYLIGLGVVLILAWGAVYYVRSKISSVSPPSPG